jgi:heme oxygenase
MNTEFIAETFLERLRTTTAPSHKHLEDLPVSVSIMDPQVSAEQYSLYLQLMHDIVKDTEENIFPLLKQVITDIDERRKAHLIESDLQHLGIKKDHFFQPLTHSLQSVTTAFALGIMYVVEGSSLGGRVILKNISEALGYDANAGARYFAGYGQTTGSHWKKFLTMLTDFETAEKCEDEIIAGADFAFNAIAAHLNAPR